MDADLLRFAWVDRHGADLPAGMMEVHMSVLIRRGSPEFDVVMDAAKAKSPVHIAIETEMLTDPGTLLLSRGMPPASSFGIEPYLPKVLPAGWAMADRALDGAAYRGQGMVVIVSGAFEQDGKRWLHVSFSRPHKLPSYEDQALVKATFIGADRYAYTVLPPADKHVNQHKYCLHLWSCLDGPVLPDFTRGGNSL